jgi:hypothetical protein
MAKLERTPGNRPNGGVEAWRVTAAGEDSDSHAEIG